MNSDSTLLSILGFADGTLEPVELDGAHWQADQQIRASFLTSGTLEIPNLGDDPAGRKKFLRDKAKLADLGLLSADGDGLCLTPQGDEHARRLAGIPTLTDSLDLLAAIAAGPVWTDGQHVSEASLVGLEPCGNGELDGQRIPAAATSMLMFHVLPLLSARLVTWRATRYSGLYLYALTDAGRREAGRGDAGRWFKGLTRPKRFTPSEAYCGAWQRAMQSRQTATPRRKSMVHHLDPIDPPA